jgi:hypothetical protein
LVAHIVSARDGDIGSITDFLFDDNTWLVRWIVVDTGNWLPGRKVLLPPFVLGQGYDDEDKFFVRLSMEELRNSPGIDPDKSVSRQMESRVYDYFGWKPYWGYDHGMGGFPYPSDGFLYPQAISPNAAQANGIIAREDHHLRSVSAVTGYHIHATEGEIGHVENFLIDDRDWSIRHLIVDTKD